MSIIQQPRSMFKGEDRTYTLTVVDVNGDRVDITGFVIEFEVKPAAGDPDAPTIAKSIGSGITIAPNQDLPEDGGNRGEATIEIDPSDTNGLTAQIYKYDVIVEDGSSERFVVIPPSDFDLREVVNIAP